MISQEINAMLMSLFWGMILAFEYDNIRVIRRVITHRHLWVMCVEDIIFWINAGFTIFIVTFDSNDGVVRGFLIAGFTIGALIFKYSFGCLYVKYVSKFLRLIYNTIKKIVYRKNKEDI